MDDTFLVFDCESEVDPFFEWMNQQHPQIKFTKELENNQSLPFLDVLIKRSSDNSLTTSVYRKPTFSGLYLNWSSFVPKAFKRSLVSGLLHRAWRLCSSFELFHAEVTFLCDTLLANGYPKSFLDSCVNKFITRAMSCEDKSPPVYGPEKKQICFSLPYCGVNSDRLKRQLGRMFNTICPWIKLTFVFKPVCKLKCLSKLKCNVPKLSQSNLVYRITCSECDEFYVGMTCRRLEQRIHEHSSRDSNSALFKHRDTTGHLINFEEPEIMAKDDNKIRLLIKETLKIQETRAYNHLNRNIGSFELKLW